MWQVSEGGLKVPVGGGVAAAGRWRCGERLPLPVGGAAHICLLSSSGWATWEVCRTSPPSPAALSDAPAPAPAPTAAAPHFQLVLAGRHAKAAGAELRLGAPLPELRAVMQRALPEGAVDYNRKAVEGAVRDMTKIQWRRPGAPAGAAWQDI